MTSLGFTVLISESVAGWQGRCVNAANTIIQMTYDFEYFADDSIEPGKVDNDLLMYWSEPYRQQNKTYTVSCRCASRKRVTAWAIHQAASEI